MMVATVALEGLIAFAARSGLLPAEDTVFARNMLLYALRIGEPAGDSAPPILPKTATPLLAVLCDHAAAIGIIEDEPFTREQFAAHLMNLLTPPPSALRREAALLRKEKGMSAVTDWFYALCRANDYIRVDEIARNIVFTAPSPYGELDITINLSKPEKDPREIAKLIHAKPSGYPACHLCIENEGYAGRLGYPSHETLRTLPVTLGGEPWRFQYSPYSYYQEHCIVLNERHVPMKISRRTFDLLLDFVDVAPHYFIGSNADLPVVGGSILNHDHFQGGRHVFPMDRAPAYAAFSHPAYPSVQAEAIRWPMTCLRLLSPDRQQLVALADDLLIAWRGYDDPAHGILHQTNGEQHSTITPIARFASDAYMLQLVLRNNRLSGEHPLGIFHPHADLHHIKKENIGLIEVMGLFVLPGRLCGELSGLETFLTGERPLELPATDDPLHKHYGWIESIAATHGTALPADQASRILRNALVQKCVRVLEDSGVFKPAPEGDRAFAAFLGRVGFLEA